MRPTAAPLALCSWSLCAAQVLDGPSGGREGGQEVSPLCKSQTKPSLRFAPQVGHGPSSPASPSAHSLSHLGSPSGPDPSALVGPPPGADPPREVVLAHQHGQVERHPANQSLCRSAVFKCHPVPRCLQITIIRGCSLKIRAQFFKKQIAQSDVLAAVRNIYGLCACAVSSSLSLWAGDGPAARWTQPSRDGDAPRPAAGSLCTLTPTSTSGRVCPWPAALKGSGQRT